MKTVLISACAAALMAVAGAATAQTPAPAVAPRIDADRDGRVSQAEFLSRLDRMAARDANGDGSITADERRAAIQARRVERRDAVFARLDADSDGSISRAEFEARPERAPRARMGGQHMRRMARHGAMGRAAARADRTVDLAQARERMTQAFARLDKDGDGYLTAEERRESRMERRQHRREMRRPSPAAPTSE